ncbi:hypothetical protein IMG5_153600 [Ichthyophthirius multifiliis]|uniref:Uncharacterized protein n=1 Tax=Ichthyophthirius multifiliis TaxID=5932 RepID=G0QZ08_ICHMU|nr:hypothetical protein IMG5_153600 [Ichthyophthirius multifiliis]EGR29543.1 hypothetical protein IMG5_153600 [Ichthyophthirius multifiliis]|eukprot:XP_004030779.1 hypothetical protein IMG5_153600 [Ichthyophthirius multifiliis]
MAEDKSCEILDFEGFILQIFLGILSFLVLIYKRHKERPKRQWKIWALDTSKQGVSALLAHMLNVILAVVLSSDSSNDPCTWFFFYKY